MKGFRIGISLSTQQVELFGELLVRGGAVALYSAQYRWLEWAIIVYLIHRKLILAWMSVIATS